jgi:hypothetical protein
MPESKATPLLPCPFGTNFCRVGDLRVYELPDRRVTSISERCAGTRQKVDD